jgi:5-methylthioribose kinase
MSYFALTEKSVVEYLSSTAPGKRVPSGDWVAKEIGDGNLNQVFILSQPDASNHFVVKQALPYLRVAGESWPLSRERMRFETQALLLQNQLAPGLVPEVYFHDEEMSVVVMEYLEDYQVMRKPLVKRVKFPQFANQIATFAARVHYFTSDLHLTGEDKKSQMNRFINPHLCRLQEEFVYTNPFIDSPENKWNPQLDAEVQAIRSDFALKTAIATTKLDYMTNAQALVHGDLHTGSIMANSEWIKVIDPEFAFYGPAAYDVGTLLANLALAIFVQSVSDDQDAAHAYQGYLIDTVEQFWQQYTAQFRALWAEEQSGAAPPKFWNGNDQEFQKFQELYFRRLLRDSAGHGGCEMLRRIMGIVSVWELRNIDEDARRAIPERMALTVGRTWLLEGPAFGNIEDLLQPVIQAVQKTSRR